MVLKRKKSGSGARKHGRNEAGCQRYRAEQKREKNKLRKLRKLLKKQPNNQQLLKRIKELKSEISRE